jgi:hypothetical protein
MFFKNTEYHGDRLKLIFILFYSSHFNSDSEGILIKIKNISRAYKLVI